MREDSAGLRHLEEVLPWYVNGSLDPAQRTWVESELRRHPAGEAELADCLRLQAAAHVRVEQLPHAPGMSRLLARLAESRRPAPAGLREHLARFGRWLAPGGAGWTPSFAAACTLVIAQAAIIGVLMVREDPTAPDHYSSVRSPQGATQADAVLLRVAVKPDAPEREWRTLVIAAGATIVGGPSQLGDYWLAVPQGERVRAIESLRTSAWVESVDETDALPERR